MKQFVGRWRITAMEMWDQDYVDLVEPGFFEFGSDGMGAFVFGAVRGWLDARVSDRGALCSAIILSPRTLPPSAAASG